MNGALWFNSGAVQLVSVESLLQAKEAGAATGFWRVDIGLPQAGSEEPGRLGTTVATKETSPELQALLSEFADVFSVPSSMPPDRKFAHEINLYDEKVQPPKLR